MYAKRTAARSRKQTARTEANEARRALVERHTDCRYGTGRCFDYVFEATRAIAEAQYSSRLTEIKDEINILINDSAWRRHVDADRVCNLTTNEVNNTELELLSLGLDFKLGCSKSSVIDVVDGFQTYATRYRSKPGFQDLQREKVRVLSLCKSDNTFTFSLCKSWKPSLLRYLVAYV